MELNKMNDSFQMIYENGEASYLNCKHCGERVERGIVTVSHHWMHCLKRTDGLIIAKNDFEKRILDSWSINK